MKTRARLPALRVWIVVETNDGTCLVERSDDPELAQKTYDQIRASKSDAQKPVVVT